MTAPGAFLTGRDHDSRGDFQNREIDNASAEIPLCRSGFRTARQLFCAMDKGPARPITHCCNSENPLTTGFAALHD